MTGQYRPEGLLAFCEKILLVFDQTWSELKKLENVPNQTWIRVKWRSDKSSFKNTDSIFKPGMGFWKWGSLVDLGRPGPTLKSESTNENSFKLDNGCTFKCMDGEIRCSIFGMYYSDYFRKGWAINTRFILKNIFDQNLKSYLLSHIFAKGPRDDRHPSWLKKSWKQNPKSWPSPRPDFVSK